MSVDRNPKETERVEAILAQLQEEIGRHRMALGQMGALEPPDPLGAARQSKWINPHLPIGWPVMPKGLVNKVVAMAQKVMRRMLRWYINPIVDQQNRYNDAVYDRLEAEEANLSTVAGELHALSDRVTGLSDRMTGYVNDLNTTSQRIEQVEAALSALISQTESLQKANENYQTVIQDEREQRLHDNEIVRFRLQRLENRPHSDPDTSCTVTKVLASQPSDGPAADLDYYLLGLMYRSEEQVQERLHDYDDLVADGLPGPFVDLGCGRGDLVAHMSEMGIESRGVDLDGDAVRIGQELGRNIAEGDLFTYLEQTPDNSLGAISAIQVIEHLSIDNIYRFFSLAETKLADGGLIIAETVNPSCVAAITNAFLLDPSHVTPVHAQMAKFLMESAGLADVELRYLRPVPERGRLRILGDKEEQINWGMLNQMLYGPQDYAAIAFKRGDA